MNDEVEYLNYKGYNGNANLKRAGVGIDWTPDMLAEYMKCANDPVYFCRTYMKIIHVDKGLVNFDLYSYQENMLRSMHENRYTILATARQIGKSTTTCAFILWYIIFNPEKTVALLANKGDTAREILGKVQLAYQHLPKWLQQGVVEWNKGSFVLENQSRVIAAATSSDSIRGYAINLLFIDEAAFIENWDEFFNSTFPTISSGETTKVVLVSTPNGMNHFYKTWDYAQQGKNEYNPIKVMWYDVPGRDDSWKERTLAAMSFDYEKFSQEHEVEFLGSSGTLIAGWKLKEMVVKPAMFARSGMYIYEEKIPGKVYVCVVDVSHGKGLDYSAFHIIDVSQMPYKQVVAFRNNTISPIEYAETVARVCKMYNEAAVLVETNDIGGQVVDSIYNDYEYENILYTAPSGRAGKQISNGFGSQNAERGVRTTKVIKSVGCSLLKLLIEQNQLIINDHNTILELTTFSRKGNSYEAEPGNHDDLVMPLVLFAWMSDQNYFKDMTDINTLQKLREKSEEELMSDLLPYGFLDDGNDNSAVNELGIDVDSPHWMRMASMWD
jgi:hypothetical protein